MRRERAEAHAVLKNAISINFPSPNQPWDTYPGIPDRPRPASCPFRRRAGRAGGRSGEVCGVLRKRRAVAKSERVWPESLALLLIRIRHASLRRLAQMSPLQHFCLRR